MKNKKIQLGENIITMRFYFGNGNGYHRCKVNVKNITTTKNAPWTHTITLQKYGKWTWNESEESYKADNELAMKYAEGHVKTNIPYID